MFLGYDHDAEFVEFYQATWARLFRTAYGVAGDRALAEDCLQSAFAKAYGSWETVRAADHPEAYVRRMAVNEVLSTFRRPWYRAERSGDPPPDAAQAPSHENATVDREALWRAVTALPPRQRAVVVLRYYEDLSEAEIAATLGCSRGTVKSQASDALRRLRVTDPELDPTGDRS